MLAKPMAGVTFKERMEGFLGECEHAPSERGDYRAGAETAQQAGHACHFDATMVMEDIGAYVRDPEHRALMTGSFFWGSEDPTPIRNGQFQLYVKNPDTGVREMRYRFDFDSAQDESLTFSGVKWMKPKSRINTWAPSTTLYSTVSRTDGSVAWCGVLTIGLKETAKLFGSLRPINATDRSEGRRAVLAFNKFFMGEQIAMLREG